MYSVKIYNKKTNTSRYILWCDERWYETCSFDNRIFTYEQAKTVVEQMKNHYQYHVSIVGDNGEEFYDYGNLAPKKHITKKKKESVSVISTPKHDDGFINLGF